MTRGSSFLSVPPLSTSRVRGVDGGAAVWSSVPKDTTPLVRTDFTSDILWQRVVQAATTPSSEGFLAIVHFIDSPLFDGAEPATLRREMALTLDASLLILADHTTMTHKEVPLLCLTANEQEGWLRVIPAELWSIENNIRLANMDFYEYVESAGVDGIFRGFK